MKYVKEYGTLFESNGNIQYMNKREISKIQKSVDDNFKHTLNRKIDIDRAWSISFIFNTTDWLNDQRDKNGLNAQKEMNFMMGNKLSFNDNNLGYIVMFIKTHFKDRVYQIDRQEISILDYLPIPSEIEKIVNGYKEFYDHNKVFLSKIKNYLYVDRIRDKKRLKEWENYWRKRIKNNYETYSKIYKSPALSDNLKKEWKHLGAEFGLFD